VKQKTLVTIIGSSRPPTTNNGRAPGVLGILGLALLAFIAALPICAASDQNADDEPSTARQEEAASSDEPTTDTAVVKKEEEEEQDEEDERGEQDEAPKQVSLKTVYKPKPQQVRLKPVLKDDSEETLSAASAQSEGKVEPPQTASKPDEPPRQANLAVIKKPDTKQAPSPPPEKTVEEQEVAERPETTKVAEKPKKKAPEETINWDRLLKAPASASILRRLNNYVVEHRDSPRLPEALLRIGRINLELGNPEEALMALRAASSVAVDLALVHQVDRGLAEATTRTGEYKAAVIHWGKVADRTARQDERVESLIGMGMALTAQGRLEDARAIWRGLGALTALLDGSRATELQAATLLGQALTAELVGQSAEAISHFNELLSLYPRSPQARIAINRVIDLRVPLFE